MFETVPTDNYSEITNMDFDQQFADESKGLCLDPSDCDYESVGYQWALSEATLPITPDRMGDRCDQTLLQNEYP